MTAHPQSFTPSTPAAVRFRGGSEPETTDLSLPVAVLLIGAALVYGGAMLLGALAVTVARSSVQPLLSRHVSRSA